MVNIIQKIICQILSEHPPESIIGVGNGIKESLGRFSQTHPQCRITEVNVLQIDPFCLKEFSTALNSWNDDNRFDLGIVSDTIEHLDRQNAEQLLARLRDLHTQKLLVVLPIGDSWTDHQSRWRETDLLALGFAIKTKIRVTQKPVFIYAYDIASYKSTPDWLNNKYWANPQLWDKFRW